jgi:undecaprenyl-diphosphatase
MLEQLKQWDQELLLWLNGFHSPGMDPIMFWVTKTEFWIPLYLLLLYLIFRDHKKAGWYILAGLILSLALSDLITYRIMKPLFHRLRPSHEPGLQGLLHIVNDYRGGLYGFASSHAANCFGIAFFIHLQFRKSYRWVGLMFLWAFIMSYTRIYLGVHYPGDILVGGLVGLLAGYIGYRFSEWMKKRMESRSKNKAPE